MIIDEAITFLRENGFSIVPPKSEPQCFFVIKFKDGNGNIKFSFRKNRYSRYITEWPEGTEIAKVSMENLVWEDMHAGRIKNQEEPEK